MRTFTHRLPSPPRNKAIRLAITSFAGWGTLTLAIAYIATAAFHGPRDALGIAAIAISLLLAVIQVVHCSEGHVHWHFGQSFAYTVLGLGALMWLIMLAWK